MGTLYRNGVPYIGGGSGSEEASQIHYDNTKSGIPSTSVQGAIDELNDDLTSLDSTTIETFDGATAVNAALGNPATISDATGGNAVGVTATLDPIQDFNGYDHPWAGGAGKNLLKVTATTATSKGITFTVNDDGSVKVEGTTDGSNVFLNLNYTAGVKNIPVGTWKIGLLSDDSKIGLRAYAPDNAGTAYGMNFKTITVEDDARQAYVRIQINDAGTTVNTTVYPMILSSDETDTSWAPYSNICPISGRTSVDVNRTGKNLWGGEKLANDILRLVSGSTINQADNSVNFEARNVQRVDLFSDFKADTQYTFILKGMNGNLSSKDTNISVVYTDGTSSYLDFATAGVESYCSFTSAYNKSIKALRGVWKTTNTTLYYNECGIFEGVLTKADFEPYTKQSVTVNLGQTVYGGTLNVTTGELTVKTANIASYNGESIGEPWWSSMDEYVEGATPAIGAQVVYTLANPVTSPLTPAQIQLLMGTNVISTSADGMLVRYYVSGKSNVEGSLTYLSGKIAALDADKTDYFTIANNTDLNTLLTSGVYRSPNTTALVATLANCPVGAPFTMLVTGSGKTTLGCVQTIFTDNYIYVRRGNNGGFLRWVLFVSDAGLTVQFPSTGWTTTETVNGTTYYTQTVSVTMVGGKPIIGITPISGTLPTSAEQKAFDSVSYFTANDTTNTIKAYATSAPSDTFAVVVKGAR